MSPNRIPVVGLPDAIRRRLESMEPLIAAAVETSGCEGIAHWGRRFIGYADFVSLIVDQTTYVALPVHEFDRYDDEIVISVVRGALAPPS